MGLGFVPPCITHKANTCWALSHMIKTTIHKSPSNFPKLVESLFEKGYDIVSCGTENHLVLVKLRDKGTDGSRDEFATNPEKLFFEFENARVLITDQKISRMFKVVEDCRAAGILVMIITGDNQNIAEAICREIGVFGADEDIHSTSPTRKEFMSTLRDPKVHLRQNDGFLFSKVEPKHKQKIVRLLKEDVEVVAETVDGVNDASTLKLAKTVDKVNDAFKQVSTISFLSLEDKTNFQGGSIVMTKIITEGFMLYYCEELLICHLAFKSVEAV